jgi:hypothetical protein
VDGAPLLGPGGELFVLDNRVVSIGTICTPRRAKLKRRRPGTAVKVAFPKGKCTGFNRKVVITALITDNCSVITGKVRAGGAPVDFTGRASQCGDGVVDSGNNEQCDGSPTGCEGAQACNADCT